MVARVVWDHQVGSSILSAPTIYGLLDKWLNHVSFTHERMVQFHHRLPTSHGGGPNVILGRYDKSTRVIKSSNLPTLAFKKLCIKSYEPGIE